MKTLGTNADNDLYLEVGKLSIVKGAEAQCQIIESLLQTQQGELQFDEDAGIDYFGTVLQSPRYIDFWAAQVRSKVEALSFVSSVEDFTYTFDGKSSTLFWSMTVVNTDDERLDLRNKQTVIDGSPGIDVQWDSIYDKPTGIDKVASTLSSMMVEAAGRNLNGKSTLADVKNILMDVTYDPSNPEYAASKEIRFVFESLPLDCAIDFSCLWFDCTSQVAVKFSDGKKLYVEAGTDKQISFPIGGGASSQIYTVDEGGHFEIVFSGEVTAIRTHSLNATPPEGKAILQGIDGNPFPYYNTISIGKRVPLASIGDNVFLGAKNLLTIQWDTHEGISPTIGDSAFNGCTSLLSLAGLPSTLASVGDGAFSQCYSLTSLMGFPATVTNFGDEVFSESGLVDLNGLPYHVHTIGDRCFAGCANLTSLEGLHSDSLTSLGDEAFAGTGLTSLDSFPADVDSMGTGMFKGCTELTNLAGLPSALKGLGANWFEDCTGITEILYPPEELETIGAECFKGCSALSSVYLPSSIKSLGPSAFAECSVLSDIFVDGASQVLDVSDGWVLDESSEAIFYVAPAMLAAYLASPYWQSHETNLDIFSISTFTLKDIVANTRFFGTSLGITSDSIYTISYGDNSEERHFLKSSATPENHDYTSDSPELGYVITLRGHITAIASTNAGAPCIATYNQNTETVEYSKLHSVQLGDTIDSIGRYAFGYCSNLGSIGAFPERLKTIGEYAFYQSGITTLPMLPNSVETIKQDAFAECTSLTTIIGLSGEGLKTIESSAFANCTALTTIASAVGGDALEVLGDNCFDGCTSLSAVGEIGGNGLPAIGKYVFRNCTSLVAVPEMSDTIDTIGEGCFYGCSNLVDISGLSTGITAISDSCFRDCTSLTAISSLADADRVITAIGHYAFTNTGIPSITVFPSGLKTIGAYAFYQCTSLSTIDVVASALESIGAYAFANCIALVSVEGLLDGPALIAIGDYCFSGCNALVTVDGIGTISTRDGSEESITALGKYVFQNCYALAAIPPMVQTITAICEGCFINCRSITSLEGISAKVTVVGASAFEGCSGLVSLIGIPYSLAQLGNGAFRGCSSLESLDGLIGSNLDIGEYCFAQCSGLQSIAAMSNGALSLTRIGAYAFEGCGITSLLGFPANEDSSIEMGGYLFKDCTSITSLEAMSSTTKVFGEGWFQGCTSLSNILNPPSSLTTIGENCFRGCSSLSSVYLPASLTSIGQRSFAECAAIEGIFNDAAQVPELNGWLFDTSIEDTKPVYVPQELLSAYRSTPAWSWFSPKILPFSLTTFTVSIDADGTEIGGMHIKSNTVWTVSYGDGTAELRGLAGEFDLPHHVYQASGEYTIVVKGQIEEVSAISAMESPIFYLSGGGESPVTSFSLASSVSKIGIGTFNGTSSLTGEITLPTSLREIGEYAFANTGITKINNLPTSLETIGDSAFENCTALVSISGNIGGNSLTYLGNNCFYGCSNLTSVGQIGGDSLTTLGTSVFEGCEKLSSLPLIPDTITTIGDRCFWGCASFRSASIPNSIETVGASAFENCSLISSLTLGTSVKTIGSSAFSGCESLASLVIPDAVESIGATAFSGCIGLSSVTMGSGVRQIGADAFIGCSSNTLTSVNISDLSRWCQIQFATIASNPLSIARNLYKDDIPVTNLVGLEFDETSEESHAISRYAFYNCLSLTSLTGLPETLESIGIYCFCNCENLQDIEHIPSGVSSLSEGCFSGCTKIEALLYPPANLASIGKECFKGCTSLHSVYLPPSMQMLGIRCFEGCIGLEDILCESANVPAQVSEVFLDTNDSFRVYVKKDSLESYKFAWPALANRIFAYGVNKFYLDATAVGDTLQDASGIVKSNSLWCIAFGENGEETRFNRSSQNIPGHAFVTGDLVDVGTGTRVLVTIKGYIREIASTGSTSMFRDVSTNILPLTAIELSAPLARIGDYTFAGIETLVNRGFVSLNEGLKEIGTGAFKDCTALQGIVFPESLMDIGDNAFEGCSALHESESGQLIIPDAVETIGERAFHKCPSIREVCFGNNVTNVGDCAFYGDFSREITNSIEKVVIKSLAAWCEIDFENELANPLYRGVAYACPLYVGNELVTAVKQIEGARKIGAYTFYYNTNITEVILPDSVIELNDGAFYRCGSITSFRLGNGLRCIKDNATFLSFADNCIVDAPSIAALCSIDYEGTPDQIAPFSQSKITIKGAELPHDLVLEGMNKIPYGVFSNLSGLTSVTIAESVETIEDFAFSKCKNLTSVVMSEGVKHIGYCAFETCSRLTSISIPTTLESIGQYAFDECPDSAFRIVYNSLDSIVKDGDTYNITVPYKELGNFDSINNWIVGVERPIVTKNDEPVFNPPDDWLYSLTITESDKVKGIADYAFSDWGYLGTVSLLSGIKYIGSYAFIDDDPNGYILPGKITSVIIQNSVRVIGEGAFEKALVSGCYVQIGEQNSGVYQGSAKKFGEDAFAIDGGIHLTIYGQQGWVESEFENRSANPLAGTSLLTIDNSIDYANSIANGDATYVGKNALPYRDWQSINLPKVTEIHEGAFYYNGYNPQNMHNSFGPLTKVEKEAFSGRKFNEGIPFRAVNNNTWALGINEVYWDNEIDFGSENTAFYPIAIADGEFTGVGEKIDTIKLTPQLTYIGSECFKGKTHITTVSVEGGGGTIGSAVFMGCTGLSSLSLEGDIPKIGKDMFNGCSLLASIEIPNTTVEIEEGAFANCTGLRRIVIPASVKTIGARAFQNCKNLETVIFEGALETVGMAAFAGCDMLEEVHVSSLSDWYGISFADVTANPLHYADVLYVGNTPITSFESVVVSERALTAEAIGAYAFAGYRNFLDVIEIPDSITAIGEGAFARLPYVKGFVLPQTGSITEIGARSFEKCPLLESMVMSPSIETIGDYAFFMDDKLSVVSTAVNGSDSTDSVFPSSILPISTYLKHIGDGAFAHTGLTQVDFGEMLETIGQYGFASTQLTSIYLPYTTQRIGDYAFAYSKLATVNIAEGVDIDWGYGVFEGTDMIGTDEQFSVVAGLLVKYNPVPDSQGNLPSTIEVVNSQHPIYSIAANVFAGHSELTSVTMPAQIRSIGENAFSGCTNLATVVIENPEAEVSASVFTGCSALTNVTIPQSICTMGLRRAFPAAYNKITDVTLPAGNGTQRLVNHIYIGTFSGCSKVTHLNIWNFAADGLIDGDAKGTAFRDCPDIAYNHYTEADNEVFCFLCDWIVGISSEDSSSVDYDGSTDDIYYDESTDESTVEQPFNIKGIVGGAFVDSHITSVDLSQLQIKAIQSYTFYDCAALEMIRFCDTISTIGNHAFEGCSLLTSNDEIDTVKIFRFSSMLQTIGENGFDGCSSLKTLYFTGNSLIAFGKDAFKGIPGTINTHVRCADFANWCAISFGNAEANPLNNGRKIYTGIASDDDTITIPEGVKEITPYAFYHLTNSTLILPATLETIGHDAFNRNDWLNATIKFNGTNVKQIGASAFHYPDGNSGGSSNVKVTEIGFWYEVNFENKDANPLNSDASNLYINEVLTSDVIVPADVTVLKAYTFYGWQGLHTVTIPSSVTAISDTAFMGCSGITTVSLPQVMCGYEDVLVRFFHDSADSITTVAFAEDVIRIGEKAFLDRSTISTVTLPSNLIEIEGRAFYDCIGLSQISIPLSVVSIGQDSFIGCSNLTTVTIGKWIEQDFDSASNGIRDYFPNIRDLTILLGVEKIGAYACRNAFPSLTQNTPTYNVAIPSSIVSIGEGAFLDCASTLQVQIDDTDSWCNVRLADSGSNPLVGRNLYQTANSEVAIVSSLSIGSEPRRIRRNAFNGCTNAMSVTGGNSLKRIDTAALNLPSATTFNGLTTGFMNLKGDGFGESGSSEESVTQRIQDLGGNIYTAPFTANVFAGLLSSCSRDAATNYQYFVDFYIPTGITNVGPNASRDNTYGLKTISSSITFCGTEKSFSPTCLPVSSEILDTSVSIPSTVSHIASSSFTGHPIDTDNSINIWAGFIWGNELSSLTSISVIDSDSSDSVIDSDSSDIDLVCSYRGIVDSAFELSPYVSSLSISNSNATVLGCNSFMGCANLASVSLSGSGILNIWDNAFALCTGLTSATIGNTVTDIWDGAFYGCSSLQTLNIGSAVEAIWDCAFGYCTSLTTVTIPASVKHIEHDAFAGCSAISFKVNSGNTVFRTNTDTGRLQKQVEPGIWVDYDVTQSPLFPYVVESASGILVTEAILARGLKNEMPSQYASISSIVIVEGATEIPAHAFDGCISLVSITIPASVRTIEAGAFAECESLTTFKVAADSHYFSAGLTPEPVRSARESTQGGYNEGGMLYDKIGMGGYSNLLVAVAPASFLAPPQN